VLPVSNVLMLAYVAFARRATRMGRAALVAVLVAGGLAGWHFGFAALALWIFTWFHREVPQRRFLLWVLPLVSMLTIALNFLHFYLLRGGDFVEILGALNERTQRMPLGFF